MYLVDRLGHLSEKGNRTFPYLAESAPCGVPGQPSHLGKAAINRPARRVRQPGKPRRFNDKRGSHVEQRGRKAKRCGRPRRTRVGNALRLRWLFMMRKSAVPTDAAKPSAPGEISPSGHRSLGRRAASALIAVGVAASTVTAALWTAAIGRFFVPPASADQRRKVRIGRPAEFAADSVDTRFAASLGVWIVCEAMREGRRFTALRTRCTHLGCITTWRPAERMFKCPCHGSGFRVDGINVEGPAPRPLERCAIAMNSEGELEVDLGRTFRAEQGQWSDPASFVFWKPPA